VIYQEVHSTKEDQLINEMRNARRVIECFIADDQIEVQYLKKFNRFR
jgi:hypothetical protein